MSSFLQHVIGVRLRGNARLQFFATDEDGISHGSWVLVPYDQGEEPAQVVIASNQMVNVPGDMSPESIIRVLGDAEIGQLEDRTDIGDGQGTEPSRLIGGVGFLDPACNGVSLEDELFRAAKQRLPRLGERCMTNQGPATVFSIDVFKELVTIRYDESGESETLRIADLQYSEPSHSED